MVATHFHEDCIVGLEAFHKANIPSYANESTLRLLNPTNVEKPKVPFKESIDLKVGEEKVLVQFFGEGHTLDNVAAYFPTEKVLFGGCLVKTMNASKGFLGDANVEAWPKTIREIKRTYPKVEVVIPGHGNSGGPELLDYTITLFEKD